MRDGPVSIEVSESMLAAGRSAFEAWVTSDQDELSVSSMPSKAALNMMLSAVFFSMASTISAKPESLKTRLP